MIVPMKHLDLVCLAGDRDATLEALRALGAVHLDLGAAVGVEVTAAKGDLENAEKAVRLIQKAREIDDCGERRPHAVAEILALDADRATLQEAATALARDIRTYEPFGDFDPALARKVADEAGVVTVLREDGTFAFVEKGDEAPAGLPYPTMRLARMREKLERIERRIAVDTAKIAVCDENAVLAGHPALAQRIAFAAARELLATSGDVAAVSGWIPAPRIAELEAKAKDCGWATLLRDPEGDETPPTLVEPPRLFAPMRALFAGIGIAPGYTESDVSVPFMCYFSLFFAMLVGDGAYGAIFLAATLWGWRKYRGARAVAQSTPGQVVMKSWLVLMTVFSSATILWGLLSNTWFGASLPCCADWPTVTWLADPSYHNMMLLCFTIGVSQLMLARVWNGICLAPDLTCLAQFGWAGILLFMYLVTNAIVGIFPSLPAWSYWMFGVSLAAVFGFTLKPSELKTRGAELGMLPLNVMSALGDIISYVRLFAVGLASVKVAENFNAMATGLLSGEHAWYVTALMSVAMVAILLIGHGLNLAMAMLSILVHAVRLNTLEFSNHKGVTWSGYAYRPFGTVGSW